MCTYITCISACMHSTRAQVHTCINTYIIHTCSRTHTHIHTCVQAVLATGRTNECSASGCQEKVRPHPRMAFGFRHHKIVPVQAIHLNDGMVKVVYAEDGEAICRRFHRRCFGRDAGSQQLARKASPEKTDEILADIAREDAEAAVPSPLSFIQRPLAWLSHMPCACMFQCRKPCGRCFCAQLARNRAVSVIARRQHHAGGFDRPAGGGSLSCRGQDREKTEDNTRRRERWRT